MAWTGFELLPPPGSGTQVAALRGYSLTRRWSAEVSSLLIHDCVPVSGDSLLPVFWHSGFQKFSLRPIASVCSARKSFWICSSLNYLLFQSFGACYIARAVRVVYKFDASFGTRMKPEFKPFSCGVAGRDAEVSPN